MAPGPEIRRLLRSFAKTLRPSAEPFQEEFAMQVKHILRDKGHQVMAVQSHVSLVEAARQLARNRIGALIVRDKDGGLAGIVSERDLVRAIAEAGADALADPVSRHMTRSVATCTECDSVDTIMESMTRGRFRHMPVLDEQERLCGLISISDVVKTRIAETVIEAEALRGYISAAM
jgi:CBS domain-containing protein